MFVGKKARRGDPERAGQEVHRLHFSFDRWRPAAARRTGPRAAGAVHAAGLRVPPRLRLHLSRQTAADTAGVCTGPADPGALLGLLDRRARVRLSARGLGARRTAGAARVR